MAQSTAVLSPGGAVVELDCPGGDLDDLRAMVTFDRRSPVDCGQRQIFVKLDDDHREVLLFGEAVTIDVPPGRHTLRVHNTLFWKKIPFAIEPGEHLEFQVINRARWWTYGMAGLLGAAPIFLIVRKYSLL